VEEGGGADLHGAPDSGAISGSPGALTRQNIISVSSFPIIGFDCCRTCYFCDGKRRRRVARRDASFVVAVAAAVVVVVVVVVHLIFVVL